MNIGLPVSWLKLEFHKNQLLCLVPKIEPQLRCEDQTTETKTAWFTVLKSPLNLFWTSCNNLSGRARIFSIFGLACVTAGDNISRRGVAGEAWPSKQQSRSADMDMCCIGTEWIEFYQCWSDGLCQGRKKQVFCHIGE